MSDTRSIATRTGDDGTTSVTGRVGQSAAVCAQAALAHMHTIAAHAARQIADTQAPRSIRRHGQRSRGRDGMASSVTLSP